MLIVPSKVGVINGQETIEIQIEKIEINFSNSSYAVRELLYFWRDKVTSL